MFLIIFFTILSTANAKCLNDVKVNISGGVLDEFTKSILHNNVTFQTKDYYREGLNYFGCICQVKQCVKKCCPHGQLKQNGTCVDHADAISSFDIYKDEELLYNTSDFHVVPRNESCTGILYNPTESSEDTFFLQKDGQIYVVFEEMHVSFDMYCLEIFLPDSSAIQAHVCNPEDTSTYVSTVNSIGMIISMPFLLITFIVYALLPERNVHAKCLMCYVSSLMCAYMFLVIMQFSANLNVGCIVLAVLCLYFFMTSFCWMNISCIDIFWTFSGKRGFGLTNKSAEMKRFLLYCTYTYGLPLILIGLVLGLNNMEDKSAWYHPNFANAQCWLGSGYPLLIYFYGPMGIMLVFNIVLFTLTALKIRQINNDTAMLNKAESQKHYENDKQTFNLYFKLLLALGINWIMEFISWLVDWMLPEHKKIPQIWYLTDFCNAIYGVFIFIIFVCKRNILMLLKKRYYIFMGQPQKARNLSMRTSSYEMSQTEKSVVY